MQNSYLPLTQRVVTLAAGTSTQLAAKVTFRGYLAIQNIGGNDATVNFDAPAVSGQGWLLAAGGGGMTWANGEGVPTNQLTAISTSGTTIVVIEG
jgi:hypothetical protein